MAEAALAVTLTEADREVEAEPPAGSERAERAIGDVREEEEERSGRERTTTPSQREGAGQEDSGKDVNGPPLLC